MTAFPTDVRLLERPGRRTLEVRVSGPADGTAVVFHHGTPGSSLPYRSLARAVHARGLRLVTFSRPGYGASSRLPDRSVADVAADTDAVLDALGVDRCLVAGWSGGGPHALACGARVERTEGVLVIAGFAPHDAEGLEWSAGMGEDNVAEYGVALEGAAALREWLDDVARHVAGAGPAELRAAMASLLPAVDRQALDGELGEDLAASFHDALSNGVDGWLDDDLAFVRPWGFDPGGVSVPTAIWQGSADLMVPEAHGTWLAQHVPGATLHRVAGAGHLSIAPRHLDEMLAELTATLAS